MSLIAALVPTLAALTLQAAPLPDARPASVPSASPSVDRSLPQAAAASTLLAVGTVLVSALVLRLVNRRRNGMAS